MKTNSRQINPDLLKALSIFGVVYIHCFWIVGQDTGEYFAWLCRIAVPCFIVLWAYFAELSVAKGKSFLEYVPLRFLHLFKVFVIWSLIYLFLKESWTMPTVTSWLIRNFGGGAWAGQYFFLILFQLLALFFVIRWVYSQKYLRIAACLAFVLMYVWLGWFYDSVPDGIERLKFKPFVYSLPYVFLGIALARRQIMTFPRITLLTLVLVPIEFATLNLLGKSFNSYLTPTILIAAIAVSAVAITRPSIKCPVLMHNIIQYIGSKTLVVFVANPLVIGFLGNKLLERFVPLSPHPYLDIPLAFLFAVGVLAICLLLAWGIDRLKLKSILG